MRKSSTKKKDKVPARTKLKQQFVIALTLSLLFGLGWGVGLLATTSIPVVAVSYTLQAIFILLTGFQGLIIFIMNCVRSPDARYEWKRWVSIITCRRAEFERKQRKSAIWSGRLSSRVSSTATTGMNSTFRRGSSEKAKAAGAKKVTVAMKGGEDETKLKDLPVIVIKEGTVMPETGESRGSMSSLNTSTA